MSGIQQYSQLGTFAGTVNTTPIAPSPSDIHVPANGDSFALQAGYNGTNWDRWRNNDNGVLLGIATRTTTTSSPTQTNFNAKGVQIYLNVTSASGTGGLQVSLELVEPYAGTSPALNDTIAAITAPAIAIYELYPGVTGVGGKVVQRNSGMLPKQWRVTIKHVDASLYTYSVTYSLIL